MSDETPSRPCSQTDGPDEMHPAARFLFGWVEAPGIGRLLLFIVIAACAALIALDFTIDRHDEADFANTNGFYAFWGFGAFALAVLSGWPLGALLRRDEDYYGEADTTPKDVEPQE